MLVFEREPCARTFAEDLALHFEHGFVFSTPDYFIMGRPVPKDAPAEDIVNPAIVFPRAICDCWHCYLFAGDMAAALAVLPWALPWISFERKNELRIYDMGKFLDHIKEREFPVHL